jgi:GNAT superfamily N-acetyltransferase
MIVRMKDETPTAETLCIEAVEWNDPRAVAMRHTMDEELSARYSGGPVESPEITAERARVLTVDPADVVTTLLVVDAALRRLGTEWEIKRLIVDTTMRRAGLGVRLLTRLEAVAAREGATRVILQTGHLQPDAMALYERLGYTQIPIYGDYARTMPTSICYEKIVNAP